MTLLQISSESTIGYIVVFVLAFIIGVLFTRWLFRINEMADNLKHQTKLLAKIAKYNNVPHEEIYQALDMTPPKTKQSGKVEAE